MVLGVIVTRLCSYEVSLVEPWGGGVGGAGS